MTNSIENGVNDIKKSSSFATNAIHMGSKPNESTGAVIPPISLSTTFAQSEVGVHKGFEYSRSNNPNRQNFEEQIASLENGKHAFAFSSGTAACATLLHTFDCSFHIISIDDVYGGTSRYFRQVASLGGVETSFVGLQGKIVETELDKHWKPNTKLVWVESPTNPTMKVVDIENIANLVHARGALLVVDNTFLSPYYCNPINLGADIVLHSVSKYINGFSDVIMGILVTNDKNLAAKLTFFQNAIGAVPSPFDCWLAQRGAKTLHLRSERHGQNALKLANYLANTGVKNGWIESKQDILYPGLNWNDYSNIAYKQLTKRAKLQNERNENGFICGGMLSVRLSNKVENSGEKLLKELKIFTLAESLGGVESLAELPNKMTHGGIPIEIRQNLGIDERLVRLSVGIEDYEDLENDLNNALEKVFGTK